MSQEFISSQTPLGATLVAGGATFRCWAPRARRVHVTGRFGCAERWQPDDDNLMQQDGGGVWAGFLSGVADGDEYKFYVIGTGGEGYKRDPYARELTIEPSYPLSNCIVRDAASYPWHDAGWRRPAFKDLIVYQFHAGTFHGPDRERRVAKFLDVLERLDDLKSLGVTAIEPLPVVEFSSPRSLGYDGSDIFSPEMDYQWNDPGDGDLEAYLAKVNGLLARYGQAALTRAQLAVPINQLKALVDLCHLAGLAVIFDVVYNHAGFQIGGQDESLWFFDRAAGHDPNDSLYFTDRSHTGPVFAIWKREVRRFLIDNADFFLGEYHVDGLRYDQVSVIVEENRGSGWAFCRELTAAIRARHPGVIQIAEYWPTEPAVTQPHWEGGADFDATWHDGLRTAIRGVLAQATGGAGAALHLSELARQLTTPGFAPPTKAVHCVESHDEVYKGRNPRIARLAGGGDGRSWYARSRARLASGLLMTAPGIPMLFMGQEVLEDKPWSDNPEFDRGTLIDWQSLERGERAVVDHLRFTRELIALRRGHPAFSGAHVNVFHVHDANRVIAFHRWLEGEGRDLVVAATFSERTWHRYRLGLPHHGRWLEVFNSDVYDHWVNPIAAGNGGAVEALGPGLHGFAASAEIVIPANGFVVLALDAGD